MNGKYILQSAEHVEAKYPGFTAVAGPYGVSFKDKKLRTHERSMCVRSHRDQLEACPHAKVVMHGPKAWIIRKKPLELFSPTATFTSGKLGIKGGRAFVS